MSQPYRSVLYVPASNRRAMDKARGLPADAIVFDLEDAVAPDEKVVARERLAQELAKGGFGKKVKIVRINGLETGWGEDDARAVAGMDCDSVLLPKVRYCTDVDALAAMGLDQAIFVMIETADAVMNLAQIADHDRVVGFVMGTNDLAQQLSIRMTPDRAPLWMALQICVMVARSRGVVVLDGVYNAFRDEDGLRAECAQGRDFGFDGKTLIHPAQVAIANAAFAPTEAEIALARRQIDALAVASTQGKGVAVVDGSIVETLHIRTARATLAKAAAIGEMTT